MYLIRVIVPGCEPKLFFCLMVECLFVWKIKFHFLSCILTQIRRNFDIRHNNRKRGQWQREWQWRKREVQKQTLTSRRGTTWPEKKTRKAKLLDGEFFEFFGAKICLQKVMTSDLHFLFCHHLGVCLCMEQTQKGDFLGSLRNWEVNWIPKLWVFAVLQCTSTLLFPTSSCLEGDIDHHLLSGGLCVEEVGTCEHQFLLGASDHKSATF